MNSITIVLPDDIQNAVNEEAVKNGVSPDAVASVILCEYATSLLKKEADSAA